MKIAVSALKQRTKTAVVIIFSDYMIITVLMEKDVVTWIVVVGWTRGSFEIEMT